MRKIFILLGMVLFCAHLIAQQRMITGVVKDAKGSPVSNGSVVVKGTSIGTTTKQDGSFSISIPPNAKTLVFTSVGMTDQEITVGNKGIINVNLETTDKGLQEVVVVGYGTQKRAALTGAVTTVKAPDIENKPFSSIDKALQGQVAGLQSVAASGQPGSSQAILIRGISSITAGTGPLWVIDGIPVNSGDASRLQTTANLLSTINPNDIESISVLKDAASQSIYGSRAANGVIIVTTKKGKAGKTVFRVDSEIGQSDIAYRNNKYRPLNAANYFALTTEGLVNAAYTPALQASTLAGLGSGNGVDYDWYSNVTQKGKQQQYNVSAQGGNDKTTFFVSGGQFIQEGTTINSKLKRTNADIKLNHKATDNLNFGVNINVGFVNQRAPLAGGAFGNPVLTSYFILPSRPAYNTDGSYNLTNLGGLHNTIALSTLDKRFLRELSMRGSAFAEYKILQNLRFKTSYGADYNVLEEDQYNNPFHGDGAASNGRAYSYYTRYYNWVWTNTLDLQQNLTRNGDLALNAQAGYESQKSTGYLSSVQSQAFPPTTLLTYPAVGATPVTASATISDYSFASEFASASVNYQNRFVLSGSIRRDGSSRFGGNNKYGNFWSVGGTWNVDRENFMKNMEAVTQLKLRSSYGTNGNANIGNYDWLPLYGYGRNYNQLPGSAPSNVGDSDLTWELNKPFNVGVDLGFFKNRLTLTADYYIRKSQDLLLNVPLSTTSGFSSATRNIGALENKGLELTLAAIPIQTKNFTWSINANFATNKNTVTSLPGGNDITDPNSSLQIVRQGQSLRSFYLREYAGVDPANGDPLWYTDATHGTKTNVYPTATARTINGNALPKYFGSFTNSIDFKGFSFEAQLYYNFGNYVYDTWGSYYLGSGFGGTYNKVNRQLDRWQKAGDVTMIPKYVYGGNKSFHSTSSFYLNQGDFIRLRNIQIGYNIPKSVLAKVKIASAFFYVRGTNLWTWVKDENLPFDPEQGTTSSTNLNVFIPKTITAGVNLSF